MGRVFVLIAAVLTGCVDARIHLGGELPSADAGDVDAGSVDAGADPQGDGGAHNGPHQAGDGPRRKHLAR